MIRTSALQKRPRDPSGEPYGRVMWAPACLATLALSGTAFGQPASVAQPAAVAPQPPPPPAAPAPPPSGAPYYPGYAQPGGPTPQYAQYGLPYAAYAPPPQMLADVIEDEGQPLPAGFHREQRPRGAMLLAGVGVFAPLYAFSLTAAVGSNDARDRWLAVPLFGPLIDLLQRKSCSGYGCDEGARTLLGMDFLGQATGAILFTLGYAIPRDVFARGDRANGRSSRSLPVVIMPSLVGGGRGAAGLSAGGVF